MHDMNSGARLTVNGCNVTRVPARVAFSANRREQRGTRMFPLVVVVGSEPSWGDAGYSVIDCVTPERAAAFVLAHPNAAMPCWKRFEVVS